MSRRGWAKRRRLQGLRVGRRRDLGRCAVVLRQGHSRLREEAAPARREAPEEPD